MEEAQIVLDVHPSPLSESMQLESSPLSESPIVVDDEASPLSESLIVVDIEASMQIKLDTLWGNTNDAKNFTIFRTPHNISQSKKYLFEPSVISIGPFHRGQEHLRALEEDKWRFLRDFLSRGDHLSLNLCISAMKSLEKRTRRCYSEPVDDLDSKLFVEMMLLDGCFVLEYMFKIFDGNLDSINEVGWNSKFILNDWVLLENQIPFFIVEKLYEIANLNQKVPRMIFVKTLGFMLLEVGPAMEITSIISDCPGEFSNPLDYIDSIIPDPPAEIYHLVHLYYHYLVPNPEKPVVLSSKSLDLTNRIKGLLTRRLPHWISRSLLVAFPNSTRKISSMVIPSATELQQKGLKFTPKKNPKHMLDISFEYGVLKISRIRITDTNKHIFANLIAFEHSKFGKENSPFGRFVHFLDCLVNTPNDVTILQQCGIIENFLGSEEELAHFLNKVTEGNMIGSDHYLAELYTEVNRYIESSWHKHRAKLIRDYFSSPWAAISLVAALILLVLTCVQSFYAVYAYKFPPSS